jgi:hypothetical protein
MFVKWGRVILVLTLFAVMASIVTPAKAKMIDSKAILTTDSGSLTWKPVAIVDDQVTYTGNATYYYQLRVTMSIAWKSYDGQGHYSSDGPYAFRAHPSCVKIARSNGNVYPTYCNFGWDKSALEVRSDSGAWYQPFGTHDFDTLSATQVIWQGSWHDLSTTIFGWGDWLRSISHCAHARFLDINHLTNWYGSASFDFQAGTEAEQAGYWAGLVSGPTCP